MGNQNDDANRAPASSTGAEMGDSNDSQQKAKGSETSQSLEDVLKAKIDAANESSEGEGESSDAEEEGDSSAVLNQNETGEGEEGESEKKNDEEVDAEEKKDGEEEDSTSEEDDSEEKDETEEGEKPRSAEARIKELVAERNTLSNQIKETENVVRNYQNITTFCQRNGITPEQFDQALQLQALINTNPKEAAKRIAQMHDQLGSFTGDRLPADLQKKVDDGKIDVEDAKEIAQLRAEREFGGRKAEFDQQRMAAQREQETQREVGVAFDQWVSNKRSSDPDFRPKKAGEPDGKWEWVADKFQSMLHATEIRNGQAVNINPCRSAADVAKLLDVAYNDVSMSLKRRNGNRPPTPKRLSSNGSSTTNGHKPKSYEDAKDINEVLGMVLNKR